VTTAGNRKSKGIIRASGGAVLQYSKWHGEEES
jgi:hypothetical protein